MKKLTPLSIVLLLIGFILLGAALCAMFSCSTTTAPQPGPVAARADGLPHDSIGAAVQDASEAFLRWSEYSSLSSHPLCSKNPIKGCITEEQAATVEHLRDLYLSAPPQGKRSATDATKADPKLIAASYWYVMVTQNIIDGKPITDGLPAIQARTASLSLASSVPAPVPYPVTGEAKPDGTFWLTVHPLPGQTLSHPVDRALYDAALAAGQVCVDFKWDEPLPYAGGPRNMMSVCP